MLAAVPFDVMNSISDAVTVESQGLDKIQRYGMGLAPALYDVQYFLYLVLLSRMLFALQVREAGGLVIRSHVAYPNFYLPSRRYEDLGLVHDETGILLEQVFRCLKQLQNSTDCHRKLELLYCVYAYGWMLCVYRELVGSRAQFLLDVFLYGFHSDYVLSLVHLPIQIQLLLHLELVFLRKHYSVFLEVVVGDDVPQNVIIRRFGHDFPLILVEKLCLRKHPAHNGNY